MAANPPNILRPTFFGLQVTSKSVLEPRIGWFSVTPSTATVRWGDPVKQVSGGTVTRCVPADTALLGIAAAGQNTAMPVSIATIPLRTDAAGNTLVPVYLADALNQFRGQSSSAPGTANLLQTHDFQYAIPDASAPTPVITNGGTAGSTTVSYKITALTANGETLVGSSASTTTANATQSAANYNIVTIPTVANAVSYGVYRGGTNLIGIVPAVPGGNTVFNDTGQAVVSASVPTINMTGWMINLGATSTNVAQVQALDATPVAPYGAVAGNCVLFTIPAAKSQVGNVAGS
jgi:hypothetical protein